MNNCSAAREEALGAAAVRRKPELPEGDIHGEPNQLMTYRIGVVVDRVLNRIKAPAAGGECFSARQLSQRYLLQSGNLTYRMNTTGIPFISLKFLERRHEGQNVFALAALLAAPISPRWRK